MDLKDVGKANDTLNSMAADKRLKWYDRMLVGGLILTMWVLLLTAVLAAATFVYAQQQAGAECKAMCPIWAWSLQQACANDNILKNITGKDSQWTINWSTGVNYGRG